MKLASILVRPKQFHVPALVGVLVLSMTAACSRGGDKPEVIQTRPDLVPYTFGLVDVTAKPFSQNPYETKPGCPWIPEQTIDRLIEPGFEMRWNIAEFTHSTTHTCVVTRSGNTRYGALEWHARINILKKDIELKRMGHSNHKIRAARVTDRLENYAGEAFRVSGLDNSYWRCGKYLISAGSHESRHPVARYLAKVGKQREHVEWDSRINDDFIETQAKKLCGTKQQPTSAVTEFPNIAWHTYRLTKQVNPTTFGVARPVGMPEPKPTSTSKAD